MLEKLQDGFLLRMIIFPLVFVHFLQCCLLCQLTTSSSCSTPTFVQAAVYLSCVQIMDTLDSRQSYTNINQLTVPDQMLSCCNSVCTVLTYSCRGINLVLKSHIQACYIAGIFPPFILTLHAHLPASMTAFLIPLIPHKFVFAIWYQIEAKFSARFYLPAASAYLLCLSLLSASCSQQPAS